MLIQIQPGLLVALQTQDQSRYVGCVLNYLRLGGGSKPQWAMCLCCDVVVAVVKR